MSNTAKKVAGNATKEAANTANVKTTLKVVKPDMEPKPAATPPSIEELKVTICDRYNLVEKHEVLSGQVHDLKNFAASISNEAAIRIDSGSGRSFRSTDPGAVKRQIEFCRESIEAQIKEVEALLIA